MDPDLVSAMAEVMGLKAKFQNATFEAIIPGIQAGRYDVGASSFTDTKEREKKVDFVTYFNAGISFYAKTATNPGGRAPSPTCAARPWRVEKGTTEQEEAEAQSKKCTKEGKKSVTVLSFPGQNAVNLALASGRAEVGHGRLAGRRLPDQAVQRAVQAASARRYGFAPYGFAVPKNGGLAQPMLAALKELIANGTYTRILDKWGIQSGAISIEPKINGATS